MQLVQWSRKIDKNNKKVLYYVLVVNVPLPGKSSVMCPVVEMISSAHDGCDFTMVERF